MRRIAPIFCALVLALSAFADDDPGVHRATRGDLTRNDKVVVDVKHDEQYASQAFKDAVKDSADAYTKDEADAAIAAGDAATLAAANAYTDAHGGGGGGTTDYRDLTNKPTIEGLTLNGNKTLDELGARSLVQLGVFGSSADGRFGIKDWYYPSAFWSWSIPWNASTRTWRGTDPSVGPTSPIYEIRADQMIGGSDILFSLTTNGVVVATGKNCFELGHFQARTDKKLATFDDSAPNNGYNVETARYPLSASSHGNFWGTYLDANDYAEIHGKYMPHVWVTNSSTGTSDPAEHYLFIYKLVEDGDPEKFSDWEKVATSEKTACPTFDANQPETWRTIYKFSRGYGVTLAADEKYLLLFSTNAQTPVGHAFARRCECGPITASNQHHGIVTNFSQVNDDVTYRDDLAVQIGFGTIEYSRYVVGAVNGAHADSDGNLNLHASDLNAYNRAEVDAIVEEATAALVFEETDPTVPSWAKATHKPTYTPAEIGAATTAQLQSVDAKADEAQALVLTLNGLVNGSNVVFAVTNYMSGAYSLDAAKLEIRELRDGAYRQIYNSRDEINLHIADFETNKLNVTREVLRGEIAAVLAELQTDAWGRRTSTGNEAPTNTIYTTEPTFVFGGGLEYERVAVGAGAIGILTDKGAPSYTAGDSGTFMFKDATGENYFGYSMTSGYAIGVPTDGISVSGNSVTLTYNLAGSCPIVMWSPTLFPGMTDLTATGWTQLNDENGDPIEGAPFECAVDTESTPETAIVYINTGTNPQGFFSAWTSVPGSASFMTNMPLDVNAANGGGVVSSDGHTIIVPQPDGSWSPANDN